MESATAALIIATKENRSTDHRGPWAFTERSLGSAEGFHSVFGLLAEIEFLLASVPWRPTPLVTRTLLR